MDISNLDTHHTTTVQEYIEIIRDLVVASPVARVKDIASKRGVTRSSVSTALNSLRDLGLIRHEHYSYVALTEEGAQLGMVLNRRHQLIRHFLQDLLGLEPELADSEACRLEHTMSYEALSALLKYVSRITGDSPDMITKREAQEKNA